MQNDQDTRINRTTLVLKIFVTIFVLIIGAITGLMSLLIFAMFYLFDTVIGFGGISAFTFALVLPGFLITMIWTKKGKRRFGVLIWGIILVLSLIYPAVSLGMEIYDYNITIDTAPNIQVDKYLPFEEESAIVKFRSETLDFTDDLPRIDGAAALFPVYSAFVNATYPTDTTLSTYNNETPFAFRNTPDGYKTLAEKGSDVFIGVYPSEAQINYAKEHDTEFVFTQIGTEAFVFITHIDNPIDSLTSEQIKDIYSGKVTNWNEVGGKNTEIVAYQRNEGSGSQSMLKRFMGDTPLVTPPSEQVNSLMSGIITEVSDYRNKQGSIGFSFRYYVEGIIKDPNIKMLAIDGIEPTPENIRNGSYPILTPIYAVTYQDNPNENVVALVEWICGEEGQRIINETGYVGIR